MKYPFQHVSIEKIVKSEAFVNCGTLLLPKKFAAAQMFGCPGLQPDAGHDVNRQLQEMGQVFYGIAGPWENPGIEPIASADFVRYGEMAGCLPGGNQE